MLNSSTSTTHAKHLTLLASAKHFDGLRQPHRRIDGMCQQHLRRRTPSTSTAYTELKHLNGGLRKPQRRINNDACQAIRRSCKRQTNGSGSAAAKTKPALLKPVCQQGKKMLFTPRMMSVREVYESKVALHTRLSGGRSLQNTDLTSPSCRRGIFKVVSPPPFVQAPYSA